MKKSKTSLAKRLERLQSLRSVTTSLTMTQAKPLKGKWPDHCLAFPASFAQSRLWFLHQLKPDLSAYHFPILWQLTGHLDSNALRLALADLIERHPSLRTSFQLKDHDLLQILHHQAAFQLETEILDDRNPESIIQDWLQQEAATPFDLASGCLLRARLLQIAQDQHIFLINHHHIASDAWSRSVLVRDLTALYNSRRNCQPAQLQPLKVHYQDYAVWQRQLLSGDYLQNLHDFWIPLLTGLEPLELPTDHSRPTLPSHQGESLSFQIEPSLLAPFEELCRSQGATLQMGLLALLALLLHRYSSQDDFAIGIPIWGRNHPDLEPLIGFFINTLPIRFGFSADLSFRQLLTQVKATSIAAYDHQELPFEQMVEALNVERDTSRHPLVQVMLQLNDLPPASLDTLDGLDVEQLTATNGSARFDLEFLLQRDAAGGILTTLIYATDLFCGDRIQRLSEHLLTLLASVLKTPDAPVASLTLIPEKERWLIESWQHGPTIEIPDLCVHQLFEQQVERTPDAIALIFEDQQLSYRELNARANHLAHHLIDLGVGTEVIVAVCLERSFELIVALLGILKAGGAYLPLDHCWPQERLSLLLEQSGCASLIDRNGARQLANPAPIEPLPSAGPLAYISYTSGSTGIPKGVAIEHRSILRLVAAVNGFNLGDGAKVLHLAPAAFDAATFEIWGPLLNGGTLVLAPTSMPSPAELTDFLRCQSITTLWLTAGLFHALVDEDLEALASVRQVLAGGDVLNPASIRRLLEAFPIGHQLINGYGPTENTTFTCCHQLDAGLPLTTKDVSIGAPIANTVVRIITRDGSLCPIGIPGELHIGGDGLARGYLNNPELTAEKFIPDPFSDDQSARLYKSGDLVSWNPDGTLAFHGRIDQQFKLRGFRIEPGEIEANLLAHPDVAQVTVILRSDDPANPRLIAYWVPQHSELVSTTSDQLRAFLAQRLPDYMVPSAFVALEALPLTTNGKLDRKALPAPSFAGDLTQRVGPSTDLERQLHAIWAEVLGHSDFGITDNFFAIGGHSLAAARLAARIDQAIGFSLPLAALFQNPSIAGLAPLLSTSDATDQARSGVAAIPTAEPLGGDWPEDFQVFPTSYAQARLWFLHQLQPDLTAYHLPAFWQLKGDLNLNALSKALDALIERHPTLRTSFQLHGSEVLQLLHPPAPLPLEVESLGDRDLGTLIQAWQQQEASTPFDLSSGLLLRARLLQVAADEHLLLINHHHIASDGWSRSVLAGDLSELYNTHRNGEPAQLQPLKVHYQDYAAWQRQRLSSDHLQTLKDYWIPQLTGLEPLELPSDHPRPATPSYRGESLSFQIEHALLSPFEELCRSEGATLQMGLLALLALLLHRYSRQDDFAIGIPIWGRNHPDLEPLIGFFINTLPIRTRFSADLSFRQLLAQVKSTSIAAYDHQELPFEQMVEALNVERDTSRNPLVQVMLQMIELPPASLSKLDGLDVETITASSESSKLDLSFYLRRSSDQGLNTTIAYATDLFSAERIQRLAEHLLTLLASALQSPDAPADSLTLLPQTERQLIESWQKGPTIDVPDLCVHQLFEQQVERTPDAIALIFEDQELSYRELNARANQLAHHLIDLGVGPDVIVAVCLERSIELIVSLLAILKAGGAYLPMDTSWPQKRLCETLLDSHAPFVLVDEKGRQSLGGFRRTAKIVSASTSAAHFSSKRKLNLSSKVERAHTDSLAYVIYTSGSTGKPKGVLLTHKGLANLAHENGRAFLAEPSSRVLQFSSFSFDIATSDLATALCHGGTLVLCDYPSRQSPELLSNLILERSITHANLTPAVLESLPDRNYLLKTLIVGGDVCAPNLAAAWSKRFRMLNAYGPTECTVTVAHGLINSSKPISIGQPIANTQIYILSHASQLAPIGIPGELHIGGDGLARGYLNNPELTAEKFIPDPFSDDPSARLYKSGDLASWNPDGTIAFHGRIDQQIKLRGFRIEPGEIEANLLAHPGVTQVCVILRHDDPANPRLIAYWVTQHPADSSITAEQLRSFLAQRLPDYMVPSAFVALEALPLTTNGKLDRRALPAPSFSGNLEQRIAPSTDLERQLHTIWAEILGHCDFGVTDNFFLIGGNSLTLAQVRDQIEKVNGTSISLLSLFSNQTIRSLATSLTTTTRPAPGVSSNPAPIENVRYTDSISIRRFQSNQAEFMSQWPGTVRTGHRYVHTLHPDLCLKPLFWCFQGAHEFQALADDLSSVSRVSGMRSAHLTDVDIYSNPALLYQVAELYFQEIIDLQPTGPYVIGGNCQGAILANAIAWQLVSHDAEVELLIMMETSLKSIVNYGIRWNGPLALIYGKDSHMNPFRHSDVPGKSPLTDNRTTFEESLGYSPKDMLERVFPYPFSITEIEGKHGQYFNETNRHALTMTIRRLLMHMEKSNSKHL